MVAAGGVPATKQEDSAAGHGGRLSRRTVAAMATGVARSKTRYSAETSVSALSGPAVEQFVLDSRATVVHARASSCVSSQPSDWVGFRIRRTGRRDAKSSRSAYRVDVQWPRWPYCARAAAPSGDRPPGIR